MNFAQNEPKRNPEGAKYPKSGPNWGEKAPNMSQKVAKMSTKGAKGRSKVNPKSTKIRKSHTGIQHFTSLEHEEEKGRARDLSKEAKRSSRASESSVLTFPPDTKKSSK